MTLESSSPQIRWEGDQRRGRSQQIASHDRVAISRSTRSSEFCAKKVAGVHPICLQITRTSQLHFSQHWPIMFGANDTQAFFIKYSALRHSPIPAGKTRHRAPPSQRSSIMRVGWGAQYSVFNLTSRTLHVPRFLPFYAVTLGALNVDTSERVIFPLDIGQATVATRAVSR